MGEVSGAMGLGESTGEAFPASLSGLPRGIHEVVCRTYPFDEFQALAAVLLVSPYSSFLHSILDKIRKKW